MTSPVGLWDAGDPGDPDNMNAGLAQYVAFASLATKTDLKGMLAIATDGVAGNGGPPAVYVRADGTATWTLVGTLKGVVGARCTDASTQAVSGAWTKINFDTETFDSDAFHDNSTNNTRLTIPTGMGGKYLVGFSAEVAHVANNTQAVRLLVNNTTDIAHGAGSDTGNIGVTQSGGLTIVTLYDFTAADYVEVQCGEDGVSTRTVDHQTFWLWKLD